MDITGEIIIYIWLGGVAAFVAFMIWLGCRNTKHHGCGVAAVKGRGKDNHDDDTGGEP